MMAKKSKSETEREAEYEVEHEREVSRTTKVVARSEPDYVNIPPSQQGAQGSVAKPGEPWTTDQLPPPVRVLPIEAAPVRRK